MVGRRWMDGWKRDERETVFFNGLKKERVKIRKY